MPSTLFLTGASTGIGRAAALYFHQKGWNVAATMRDASKSNLPTEIRCFSLDVTKKETIRPALEGALNAFGQVDVLANNAGYGTFGPFEAVSDEQLERQFATNVTGLMYVTRAFLPHFRQRKSGIIMNISSVGGRATFPFYSLYHGTKWAVEGFSESLQFELEPLGIRVKLIEPGAIETDFAGRSLDRLQKDGLHDYDAMMDAFVKNWRAGRNPSPAELVAEVMYQAATDGSKQLRYIAGDDAKMVLETRAKITQDEYYAMIRQRVGI